ncbi:Terpene utilization protein AtuA [hydrothermal vent metagenome]|uniref:Terpene utilization protein AtuA n=1 Tax=hydrothermal vent metagenome TaxID=652676 RepID=A0A3B0S9G6_9ZZZZ
MSDKKIIKIGGASGYWGESDMAAPQLLAAGGLDYLVFDYLAEITMSLMARARIADPDKGYALDFVSSVLKQNLAQIAAQKVKVISNAGGVNPIGCGKAIEQLVQELGLNLQVAVITGDDILEPLREGIYDPLSELYSGAPLPPSEKLMSANAYLGAFPIAEALSRDADIVITGRCVDSAVTLGACIHEFGWTADDLDELAGGSLAGHVIECGPQATGGNFTDWREVADTIAEIGYPIVEIISDGSFICTKPEGSGGMVTVGTVSEQIVYEIGDPQAYVLPDVICDFSQVRVTQSGENRVTIDGAVGLAAPDSYKASITYLDGFRGHISLSFTGFEADEKIRIFTDAALARARKKLDAKDIPDYEEVMLEILGTECQYGTASQIEKGVREVVGRFAFKHRDQKAISLLIKEVTGMALASPAGLSGLGGGRPKPSPVVRLFSCAIPKENLTISVDMDGKTSGVEIANGRAFDPASLERPPLPSGVSVDETGGKMIKVPLIALAWGRSGDKGDKANIGIIARKPEYLPFIVSALTEQVVASRFSHFLDGPVERFLMPGLHAINFLLHDALGGGGIASLRNDPQGKCFAQILLDHPIAVPAEMAEQLL